MNQRASNQSTDLFYRILYILIAFCLTEENNDVDPINISYHSILHLCVEN